MTTEKTQDELQASDRHRQIAAAALKRHKEDLAKVTCKWVLDTYHVPEEDAIAELSAIHFSGEDDIVRELLNGLRMHQGTHAYHTQCTECLKVAAEEAKFWETSHA